MKKLLVSIVLCLTWLGCTFAILQPNIINRWNTITSLNPLTTYTIIQDGTGQSNITVANFANSISGLIASWYLTGSALSWYLTGSALSWYLTGDIDNFLLIANSWTYYTSNPLWYITGSALNSYTYLSWFTINTTWRTYPGSTGKLVTESAVATYINILALNYGNVITTWYYFVSWTINQASLGFSWTNLQTQMTSGWTRNLFSYLSNLRGTIFTQPIKFEWSGMVWNDIQNLQLRDTDVTAQKPTLETISGSVVRTRCFTGGTQQMEMYGTVEIPHDMYTWTGAVLSPHIHWMWSTTSNNTTWVRTFNYTIMKVWGIYSTGYTITWNTYGITWWLNRIDDLDSDFSATWLAIWDTIAFRISRTPTGGDTYAWNMCITQIGFHYQIDSLGSRQEYIK